jgi:hypothetical protein
MDMGNADFLERGFDPEVRVQGHLSQGPAENQGIPKRCLCGSSQHCAPLRVPVKTLPRRFLKVDGGTRELTSGA